MVGENGRLTHIIKVADGTSAPFCTMKAIEDHLDELATATDGIFDVVIQFEKPCDEITQGYYQEYCEKTTEKNISMHLQ